MIRRRILLAAGALHPARTVAAEAFPAAQDWAGLRLRRNGTGTRRYIGLEIYRAALYLPVPMQDATAILADPAPKLILLRYARAVTAAVAATAWREAFAANGGGPAPPALLDWVRTAAPGEEERYGFTAAGAQLSGPGRPDAVLPGAAASRGLLATWLGRAPPTEALKRGLLGGDGD